MFRTVLADHEAALVQRQKWLLRMPHIVCMEPLWILSLKQQMAEMVLFGPHKLIAFRILRANQSNGLVMTEEGPRFFFQKFLNCACGFLIEFTDPGVKSETPRHNEKALSRQVAASLTSSSASV